MRVIDGDHLKSILQEYVKREEAYVESGDSFDNLFAIYIAAGLLEAIHSIEEEPSVQPEIIHCKDCVYWNEDWNDGQNISKSPEYKKCRKLFYTRADGYCSWAERRQDDK